MMHRIQIERRAIGVGAALAAGAMTLLAGCGGEEQAEAPQQAPRPTQQVERVDPFEDLELDPRVEFPRSREPASPEQAQAVADLASAIASADEDRLRGMLNEPARAVLDTLIENGQWGQAVQGIEMVRVVALDGEGASTRVGLAVQDPQGAYVLAWEGAPANGSWQWTGLAVDAPQAERASELDGLALAEAPVPEPGANEDLTLEEIRARRAEDRPEQRDSRRGRRSRPGGGPSLTPF